MKLPTPVKEFLSEPSVAPTLWLRRLFHLLAGSSIPVGVLLLPSDLVRWGLIAGSATALSFEVGRGLKPSVNDLVVRRLPFFKDTERWQVTGATYMALSATFIVFVFDKQITVLALLFMSVGDPLAALVGVRDRRVRVFGKSLAGTGAFAGGSVAAGALASLHPDVQLMWWIVPGAIVAALVELAPLPVDDNFTVPLVAAVAMTALAVA